MSSSVFTFLILISLCSNNVYRILAIPESSSLGQLDYDSGNPLLKSDPEKPCVNDEECTAEGKVCKDEFCVCKDGYGGNGCNEVLGCKVLEQTCAEADAKCVFAEDEPDKATCQCNKEGLVFSKELKKCLEPCVNDAGCTAEGKVCKDEFCVCKDGYGGNGCNEVLGCKVLEQTCAEADAKCVFAEDEPDKATCQCNKEGLVFSKELKKCLEPCVNDAECTAEGKVCKDKFCVCKDGYGGNGCNEVLGCKVLEQTCKKVDAKCVFAEDEPNKATCQCNKEGLVFSKELKKCLVDKCKEVCGVTSGTSSQVVCTGDPHGAANVSCQCKEKEKEFVANTKACMVNKCREKCGDGSEEGIRAECSGDPFGEKSVICFCKGDKMKFSPEEKLCKKIKGLSNLAIAAISLTIIVVTLVTVAAVVYRARRKRVGTPRYSIRFQEQTISFENTLYGSTSDHPAFQD